MDWINLHLGRPLYFLSWGKGQGGFWIFVFPLDPTKFLVMLNINVVPRFPHVPQAIPIAEQFINNHNFKCGTGFDTFTIQCQT